MYKVISDKISCSLNLRETDYSPIITSADLHLEAAKVIPQYQTLSH